MFNALDNNDISKLSKMYPKYLIENLKQKKWSAPLEIMDNA